jgi:transcriptional regulator with XRE-family HTH domain
MSKISSGINDLDKLIDSLYVGDNVVWEVEAGTSSELFMRHFIVQSFSENQDIIYVSFNKSPHSIFQQIGEIPSKDNFILLDCFTSGKGKNDKAFLKFYEKGASEHVIKVDRPDDINNFTSVLNSIEYGKNPGKRYIFDSLTGMQDLWGDENSTYKFFTYMCPRLYDLGTVAYWILEKEAHSQTFKANLRHVTQVVLDLYIRKDKLFIKSLKLEGRPSREAFKPHQYEIDEKRKVSVSSLKREHFVDIGPRIKEMRTRIGMSQKELADRVDLTPSFISQLESNQISPSLSSFMQICDALGINPTAILGEKRADEKWLIKKERVFSTPLLNRNGLKTYGIIKDGILSGTLIILEDNTRAEEKIIPEKGKRLVHVLKGTVTVVINGKDERLRPGDSLYLKDETVSLLKNEGGDNAEILLISS